MQWYHYVLAATALATLVIAWPVPRVKLWLGMVVWSYVTAVAYHRLGAPYAEVYGGSTDILICVLLWSLAKTKWEMGVFSGFIFMILVNLLHAGGSIKSEYDQAVLLEIANMCVMLLMLVKGISDRLGRHGWARLHNSCHLGLIFPGLDRAIHADRAKYPKWWKEP